MPVVLYNAVTNMMQIWLLADLRRIYTYGETVQKSYSPYLDDLEALILMKHLKQQIEIFRCLGHLEQLLSAKIFREGNKKTLLMLSMLKSIKRDRTCSEKKTSSVWSKIF